MDTLSDAELARSLQLQFDNEAGNSHVGAGQSNKRDARRRSGPTGIVDDRWELIDPHPDIRALFLQFNEQFFWGRLEGIEVKWSPRMTLCAGLCCYEGYGGLCSVRLSQPLLKLRPRKDLVETLLHEMIHAYLFVTQNNKDHDGHGPEFCKHMDRINTTAGTKISIYHTFHDEVDLYRQHWWRCNGPCQQRKPYYGYVKRSMNRAPSSKDIWWAEHQRTCGGTFTKIKEPEGYKKKGGKQKADKGSADSEAASKEKPAKDSMDIRNFVPFSGKGQTVGGTSSQRPTTSAQPAVSSFGNHTLPNVGTNAKAKLNNPELRKSAGDNAAKTNISTGVSNSGRLTSPSLSRDVNSSGTGFSSSSDRSVNPVSVVGDGTRLKKPRFTPVVATASGRVLSRTTDHHTDHHVSMHQGSKGDSASASPPRAKRKFIPVVSAVGRKGTETAPRSLPVSSALERLQSSSQMSQKNCDKTTAGGSNQSKDHAAVHSKGRPGNSSGKQGSKKRARLIDLQTIFDSDSDEDSSPRRSPKVPHYSPSDRRDAGSSTASDKENSTALSKVWSDEISVVGGESDDDDVVSAVGNNITTGIWQDLSHLASSKNSGSVGSQSGNGRFGRVPPPLWGKAAGKRTRGNENDTPPRSSFCEHPWQTAAREAGGDVICVVPDNEVDKGRTSAHDARTESGPKTVPCPVCNLQIEEKKINSHLDTCLTYNSNALFST